MSTTYVKTKLPSIINITDIVTIHYFEFDRNFSYPGESHDFWEMVYVDKGSVLVRRNEETITLKQGDIIFHRPNEFHAIQALDSAPNFYVLSFVSNSLMMQCFEEYQTTVKKYYRGYLASILEEADAAYHLPKNDPDLKQLVRKSRVPFGSEQMIKIYLEQFLILLLREMPDKQDDQEMSFLLEEDSSQLVLSVKEYISAHVEEPLRVTDICRDFGYSRSYLSKLFREQSGETLVNHVTYAKIHKAKQMIREDNLSFSQISAALRFDNPQYFSRVFKRITGMTPSEFKQSLRYKR